MRGINLRWQRRLETADGVISMDENSCHSPVVLQFDTYLLTEFQDHPVPIQNMIEQWFSGQGMRAAFTQVSTLICFQIDRLVDQGDGSVHKCRHPIEVSTTVQIPVSSGAAIGTVFHEYHLLSATAHLGMDRAGHARAVMLTRGASGPLPATFLITDDATAAVQHWGLPEWISTDVQCVWYCLRDQLDLMPLEPMPMDANRPSLMSMFAQVSE